LGGGAFFGTFLVTDFVRQRMRPKDSKSHQRESIPGPIQSNKTGRPP
jgi:hypothetical protein